MTATERRLQGLTKRQGRALDIAAAIARREAQEGEWARERRARRDVDELLSEAARMGMGRTNRTIRWSWEDTYRRDAPVHPAIAVMPMGLCVPRRGGAQRMALMGALLLAGMPRGES